MAKKMDFNQDVFYRNFDESNPNGCSNVEQYLKYLPKTSGTYYYHKRSGKFAPAGDIMRVGMMGQSNTGFPPRAPSFPHHPGSQHPVSQHPGFPPPQQQSFYPQAQQQQSFYPQQPPYGNYGNQNPSPSPYFNNPYMGGSGMCGSGMCGYPQQIKSVCDGVLPMVIPSCNQYAGIPTPFPVPISYPASVAEYSSDSSLEQEQRQKPGRPAMYKKIQKIVNINRAFKPASNAPRQSDSVVAQTDQSRKVSRQTEV